MRITFTKKDVKNRIEKASDEYVDGEIDEVELEERIERALNMEYTYGEVQNRPEFLPCSTGAGRIFGKEIERGETVCLDHIIDVDPFEQDVLPYSIDKLQH